MTITARAATHADAEILLAWRNDPETRRWSRNMDPVTAEGHRAWLARTLDDDDRILLVAEDEHGPVGTARFDREDDGAWEVSVTVAPHRRGTRMAGPLLAAAEQTLREHAGPPVTLLAVVHQDNEASVRLFVRAGYRPAGTAGAGFTPHRKTLT